MSGWIKLHRSLTEWKWKHSNNHMAVFINLLLRANRKGGMMRGHKVEPGTYITGRRALAALTNLSEQQLRTVLTNLQESGEITIKTFSKFSIISITNWRKYQSENENQPAKARPDNQQITTEQEERIKNKEIICSGRGAKDTTPCIVKPIIEHLNKKTGAGFKASSKVTKSHINARLKEGFKLDEFILVIDAKCKEWKYNPVMREYLRPKTLFGTNFESYLQAARMNLVGVAQLEEDEFQAMLVKNKEKISEGV